MLRVSAAASTGELTYSCTFGELGSNVPTAVTIDTDLPPAVPVGTVLNITTSVTLNMPAAVFEQLQALPGFSSAQLFSDGSGGLGVAETFFAPDGSHVGQSAHPILVQGSADDEGDVAFSGASQQPNVRDPGPKAAGIYSITAGDLNFRLDVAAATPTTYAVTCTAPASGLQIDTLKVTATSSTAITQAPTTWTFGDNVSATARVTVAAGTGWAALTGSAQLVADGVAVGDPVPLAADGSAQLPLSTLAPGSHQISAAYVPDSASPYLASTSTSSPVTIDIGTSVAVTVDPTSVEIGDSASATATVTASDGSTAPGQVTFTVDGITGDPVPLTAGSATTALPTTAKGQHSVTASYQATGLYRASTGNTATLDVAVATTKTRLELDQPSAAYGELVTASVTVSSAHQTPTGSVTISVGDQVKTLPLEDGQAQLPLPMLPAGDYQIHADFTPTDPDAFSGSKDATALTVSQDATTTTLELGQASVPYGQGVDATATVHGTYAEPGGSVTFRVGDKTVATAALDDEHQAHATLTGLSAGTYQVVATFTPTDPGTSAVSVSNSAALTVVGDATATTLVLDPPAASYGERITATATVTGGPAAVHGTVTFTVGGRSVSAPVVGGRARATLPVLRPGTYQVNATFIPADASNVETSSSAPVSLTVKKDATTTRQSIHKTRHGTRLVCAVGVVAVHGTPVAGRVRVTLKQQGRGHTSKSVLLAAGSRTVRFSGLAKHGRWSVVATYAGSGTLAPSISNVRRGGH